MARRCRYPLIGGPLLSRFAPCAGFVALRQTFVLGCHCRRRCGEPGSGAICGAAAVARNCRRRPRTPRRKRPRPLELGGEPGRGLSLQSGSNIGLVCSACGRDVGGGESHFLTPTSSAVRLSRSDPLPGVCSIAPDICSMRPSRWGVRSSTSGQSDLAP